eukprot:CAMPEP_0167803542 /NCGR_PEP_ID=MMETSP0111_2-20121227/19898_1 /TAXON_ID=91324 /ORGANISM="Lotharella globosa, Strain CCCM811" /LENGTH=150 /DNA_ID=CAMNT_0007700031 /DNA_START=17 /DNA_END=469 /DNA_ORIENTATION=+
MSIGRYFKLGGAVLQAGGIVIFRNVRSALGGLYNSVLTGGAQRAKGPDEEEKAEPKLRTRIEREEALAILELEEGFEEEELQQKFESLMKANGEEKGASFYLQSKVFRAHERLTMDMEEDEEEAGEASPPEDSTTEEPKEEGEKTSKDKS